MKGVRVSTENAEVARSMRASGALIKDIALRTGASQAWVSKVTKGISPGQRSRFRHLNQMDVGGVVRGLVSSGIGDSEVASRLGISRSFASFLRRKYCGLKPAFAVDISMVCSMAEQGAGTTEIAEAVGVSPSFVVNIKRAAGMRPAQQISKGRRSARPLLPLLVYAQTYISYDAETGLFSRAGKTIGFEKSGYVRVAVRGRVVMGHRLAWLLHYAEEPPELIDHIDGNPLNNAAGNLRACNTSQNAFNKRRASNNTTGVKGVSQGADGYYRVRVQAGRLAVHCHAKTLEEAREARQRLAASLHGEFARHD